MNKTEFEKLKLFVKLLIPKANAAFGFADIHGMVYFMEDVHRAFDDLSDETKAEIIKEE